MTNNKHLKLNEKGNISRDFTFKYFYSKLSKVIIRKY